MKKLTNDEIKNLSFPDAKVNAFSMSDKENCLTITCDSGFVCEGDAGISYDNISIKIDDIDSYSIKEWNEDEYKDLSTLPLGDITLKDICEFIFDDRLVVFKGFSRERGLWTELSFINSKIVVEVGNEKLLIS